MEDHEPGLTASQIKKYSTAFRKFDTDKDGNINGKDLGKILRHIGHNPTEAEIQVSTYMIKIVLMIVILFVIVL